jgi:dolichol kinase
MPVCTHVAFLREDIRPHVYAILLELSLYCIFALYCLKIHVNNIFLTVLRFQILWLGSPYVLQYSPVLSSLNLKTVTLLVSKCCRSFLYPSKTNSSPTTNSVHNMMPLLLCQPPLDVEVKEVKVCSCARRTVIRIWVSGGTDKIVAG